MIIQSLEIEHFGKFRNLSLSLNAGFNVLTGANEAGKTTLACFLKGMLFGLQGSPDQKKYLPLAEDGIYGGSIRVLYEDRSYRIVRSFLPGQETLSVEDTALGSDVPDPEEFLAELRGGMDRETYEATGFVSETGLRQDSVRFSASPEKEKIRELQLTAAEGGESSRRRELQREELDAAQEELQKLNQRLKTCREGLQDEQLRADVLRPAEKEPAEAAEDGKRTEILELKKKLEYVLSEEEKNPGSQNALGTAFFVLAALAALAAWFTSRANGSWTLVSMGLTAAGLLFLLLAVLCTVRSLVKNRKRSGLLTMEKLLRASLEEAEGAYQTGLLAAEKKAEEQKSYRDAEENIRRLTEEAEELAAGIREKNARIEEIRAGLGEAGDPAEEEALRLVPGIRSVNELATVWLQSFGGRGRRVEFFGGEAKVFGPDGAEIPADRLSQAAGQSVFLAARLAAFYKDGDAGTLPLILDDVFSNFDGDRLRSAMAALKGISGQIVLFSCQRREQAEL